jgi:hypothetical protein
MPTLHLRHYQVYLRNWMGIAMSTDAVYILAYDNQSYIEPTPMDRDMEYLEEKYGGYFEAFSHCSLYWIKPKYLLPLDELCKLMADQVIERRDCELWKIIK